jgi:DNA-binding CsgD family transcriptional regulator
MEVLSPTREEPTAPELGPRDTVAARDVGADEASLAFASIPELASLLLSYADLLHMKGNIFESLRYCERVMGWDLTGAELQARLYHLLAENHFRLDNKEIARALGVSRVSVAVTLHRARRRLQRELDAMRKGKP